MCTHKIFAKYIDAYLGPFPDDVSRGLPGEKERRSSGGELSIHKHLVLADTPTPELGVLLPFVGLSTGTCRHLMRKTNKTKTEY